MKDEELEESLLRIYEQALETSRHYHNIATTGAMIIILLLSAVLSLQLYRQILENMTWRLHLILSLTVICIVYVLTYILLRMGHTIETCRKEAMNVAKEIEDKLAQNRKFKLMEKISEIEGKRIIVRLLGWFLFENGALKKRRFIIGILPLALFIVFIMTVVFCSFKIRENIICKMLCGY